MVLGTPFRSQPLGSTPGQTPQRVVDGSTPSQTPLRDQLNINTFDSFSDIDSIKQQQIELRAHLKAGLDSLPAPRNDFEIVLPESEAAESDIADSDVAVEDASEVEERDTRNRILEGVCTCVNVQLFTLLY